MGTKDKAIFGDSIDATMTCTTGQIDIFNLLGTYTAECYGPDGVLKSWATVDYELSWG